MDTISNKQHDVIKKAFPSNPHIVRLIAFAEKLNITFASSPVHEQWLYEPTKRVIYVWEHDLTTESLSFLVVILAHELGHAIDFELNPHHVEITRSLHFMEVPVDIEVAAFVQGFHIIQDLSIPITIDQYEQMIDPSISSIVRQQLHEAEAV